MPRRTPGTGLDLLVTGHLNIDAELHVPQLPGEDRTVPVLSRRESLGGTAANIARWAAHLGLRAALAAFVGPDVPPAFLARLRAEGVDLRHVVPRPGEFTPVCWIFEDGRGHQTAVIDQGAMRATAPLPLPTRALSRCRLVHLTTGDPAYQLRVARAARSAGKVVAFDPAQEVMYRWSPADLRSMLALSEIFFANEREFARALQLVKARSPAELLERVPLAVMTRGARGARAYSRLGRRDVPAARVRHFHRVTGAGDAFRGGYYRGWFAGEPLERCLAWGAAAGAAAVDRPPSPEGRLPPRSAVDGRVPRGR